MVESEAIAANKTIVVTGGLGLIGSFLIEHLVNAGARTIVVDDESKGSWRYIAHLRDRVEYRRGTLEEPSFAWQATAGADWVFHLASRAYGVGYSHGHHLEMLRFNERINTNVLDAIAENRPRHALVVSSSCVYPDDGPVTMSDREPLTGEAEKANWGYGVAKRILEQKAEVYQRETGLPITVVRPTNVYGERYNWVGERSQAIPMLTKRVLDRENPLVVWGSGEQRRNYVHASDCAMAMLRLVAKGYHDRPINIGSEETVSMRGLAERLVELSKSETRIEVDPSKPEGRFIKSADSGLLKEVLGDDLPQEVDLDSGLRRMLSWYHETFKAERGANHTAA